jgi:hypothetical protein
MSLALSVAIAASMTFSSGGFAQDEGAKASKDPGRLICKAEEQTGTRIAKKKTCMTAVQWKEQRRTSRLEIDKHQANRYKPE